MAELAADVVIIGAGPTGAAAAWRLASQGISVIILDRGHWFDYQAADRDSSDWEFRRSAALHANPNIRRAPDDYPVDDSETPIKPMIGNGVGGSSIFWSAHVPRFRPEDFRTRTLDGVGDDWPISYADLERHYELLDERWGSPVFPVIPPQFLREPDH
ncbi:FAD-dependent oxidoreductase [Devosia aurantiaca]|uniref:GMC family oxidoreductase n=1 Tax=Devosia aurantiaca TaxID=2714858 RepID=A0A6M1STX7_9HYPH|nr:FAD-dependent oxidoreductase [Devosia aurantiaca]NGP18812.1 GMC family oxidoreductase [Devosia aurantiaca]